LWLVVGVQQQATTQRTAAVLGSEEPQHRCAEWGPVAATPQMPVVDQVRVVWRRGSCDHLWAAPLSWLVWGLDLGVLVVIAAASLVAVILGTPGCEVGVVRDIARRLRSEPGGTDAVFCPAGLHQLDAWEARRPVAPVTDPWADDLKAHHVAPKPPRPAHQ